MIPGDLQHVQSTRVFCNGGFSPACIEIVAGRIAALRPWGSVPPSPAMIDAGGFHVLPGLVDIHVHLNDPGRAQWEGFDTGTRAAAGGGVTTVVDMPLNSTPVTTTLAALNAKIKASKGRLSVDCAFHAGVVPGNTRDLAALLDAGVVGAKAFLVHSGIDDFPAASEADLRAALPLLRDAGVPLLVHAELPATGGVRLPIPAPAYRQWLESRPDDMETRAIEFLVRLARDFDAAIHIVHVATRDALPIIAAARRDGISITAETCPHYLSFAAEGIPDGATAFKCAPPIRGAAHREALWRALVSGDLDCVAADHSPSPPDGKCLDTGDFASAWGGVASLGLMLPILLSGACERGIELAAMIPWITEHPARIVGLSHRKGTIAPGFDADLVIFDPNASTIVEPASLRFRHPITPWMGATLRGRVLQTILRGHPVYSSGSFAEPSGSILLRESVLR